MTTSTLAFVFPGQGSQKQGMLAELAAEFPVVEQTFAQASAVLGYDLWELSQQGPQTELDMTEVTQPLLLTASVAVWRVWQERGGATPAYMAGHSLGEWSALVCAGVVGFEDAVKLVQLRGKFMQEAVPEGVGSMAAIIGLDDESIKDVCQQAAQEEVLSAVNFNSPGQVVIAGHVGAIERAIVQCKEAGAKKAMPLSVSAPFHSALLMPAAERLAKELDAITFNASTINVVHNVHAKIETDPAVIKQRMIEQIYQPVLWVDCVNALKAVGVTQLVECGAGKVLSGLVKRIDRTLPVSLTHTPDDLNAALSV